MNIPESLYYTQDHEWLRVDNDHGIVGITDYAQSQLGDIVFVDVPTLNQTVNQHESFGSVEAVKTVADLYMPVTGKIVEVNPKIVESPELINQDPYGDGWIVRIQIEDPSEISKLLNATAYRQLIEQLNQNNP
jgi:glycine cleavage system H protein